MFARPVTRLFSSSSSKIFSTLSARTLHSTSHTISTTEFYPYFLESVNNLARKKHSFSDYVGATDVGTLHSMLNTNLRLKEVIGVNPGNISGSNLLFHKLGANHLGNIITSTEDLFHLLPTVIDYLDQATLLKIFDTSEKLVRGIIWASSAHYDIMEGQKEPAMNPSFWLNAMLDKLGQQRVIKLVSDPNSVADIFSHYSFMNHHRIRSIVKKHLGIEKPKQSEQPEKSQENDSIRLTR